MIYLISPDETNMLRDAGDRMPLGVLYLSAALKANEIPNRIIDLNHYSPEKLLEGFRGMSMMKDWPKPEAICFSFMSPTSKQTKYLINETKKYLDVPIIVGGFHVTNKPGDFSDIASEIHGYGESKLISLLDDIGRIEEFDINRYPIPNREALDRSLYNYKLEGRKATTMITSRGCPMKCSFCSNFDKHQKRRDIDNIKEEIGRIKQAGYEAVYLLDDSFTLNNAHAMRVATELYKQKLKYRIETRANHINDYVAELLAETGCLVAGMGIESGNNQILKKSLKGQTKDAVRKAVHQLGNHGIKTKGFFIIGLPGETHQSAVDTLNFAESLRHEGLAYADFYPLCPYPGSPIYQNPEKFDIIIEDQDYSHYLNGGKELVVPTRTRDLTSEQIKEFIQAARRKWKN